MLQESENILPPQCELRKALALGQVWLRTPATTRATTHGL